MSVTNAHTRITDAVLGWEGTSAVPHRFGGSEFRLGRRELGHIHGDSLVDIPFPSRVRDDLVASGQAQPHHVMPESGWVSVYLRQPDDVAQAIALLRKSYELASHQRQKRSATPAVE
jgi:Luciferase